MKTTVVAVLARLFLCLAFVAGGGIASAFAQSEEFKAKIAKLKQKAEQGNTKAQSTLGEIYSYSNNAKLYGVQKDRAKGLKWARLAAAKKNRIAYSIIGAAYEYGGDGIKKDTYKAYIWYYLANNASQSKSYSIEVERMRASLTPEQIAKAEMEIKTIPQELAKLEANFNAGKKYEKGEDVLQNYKEAARLYGLAAEKGHAFAQYRLGLMYLNGKSVAQDYGEAYIWFALAAINIPDSFIVKLRQEAEEKLTSEQLNQAQAEAAKRLGEIKKKQAAAQ